MDRIQGAGGTVQADVSAGGEGRRRTLVDARFDMDSCGVGFVAATVGGASHEIIELALTALGRLAHRGATAADGKSSDGVGLMTAVPRTLLLRETGLVLEDERLLGVGAVFLPPGERGTEAALTECLNTQSLEVLGWRDVPTVTEALGEIALGTMPVIRQVMVADRLHGTDAVLPMEQRLYLARKQFERMHEAGEVVGYVCSLSTQTVVYKAMCSGALLSSFYPDLADAAYLFRSLRCFISAMRRTRLLRGTAPSRRGRWRITARSTQCGGTGRGWRRGIRRCRRSASRC